MEVLRLRKEILGERHPNTITASNNLSLTYESQGRLNDAEALQAEVLNLRLDVLGDRYPDTGTAMLNLGATCSKLGDQHRALGLLVQAKDIILSTVGPNHPCYRVCESWIMCAQHSIGSLPTKAS